MNSVHNRLYLTGLILLLSILCGFRRCTDAEERHPNNITSSLPSSVCSGPIQNEPPARRHLCGVGIDINRDDIETIQYLPGIGIHRATAIVEYRLENGPFEHIDDLANIRGIGHRTIERMNPWLEPITPTNQR